VSRAFLILDILRSAPAPMTVQQLATSAGLDRTVTHRLIKSLVMQSAVIEDRGSYRLGPTTVLLANRYIDDLLVRRLALPYMIEISENDLAGRPWTITLSIPVGATSTVIERIWTPDAPLDLVLGIGDNFPIDATATGRSMLAFHDERTVAELVGADRGVEISPILTKVRDSGGIGLSRGEAVPGVEAVAAAIKSRRGVPVSALSVSGVDLGDQLDYRSTLAATLRRAAGAIGPMIP
jgi:IclR family transcriptional regulator, acetate operon repressor